MRKCSPVVNVFVVHYLAAVFLAGSLRLADGRGWAFDDSALFPHDPSVVRGYWQPVSVVPPGANAAAVAAAVANGTAGGGAMTDVAGSMGSMGSMKPTMDYGNQNSQGRGVNPWILN